MDLILNLRMDLRFKLYWTLTLLSQSAWERKNWSAATMLPSLLRLSNLTIDTVITTKPYHTIPNHTTAPPTCHTAPRAAR